MEMTNEEILRNYRQAKDRRMQIGILADLNQCSTVRIVEILTKGGIPAEELPKIKKTTAEHYGGLPKREVINLDTGEKFESAGAAARQVGVRCSGITNACRGIQKTAGGHRWKYADEATPTQTTEKPAKEEADTLESAIEAKLRKRVKAYGGRCLKWVSPGESGVPDRIVLLPGGRIVFVETKRPKGGKLSPLQHYWGRTLVGLGFPVWVVWNAADVAEFERQVLGGER